MDLLIKNARIEDDRPLQDVAIDDGKIIQVAEDIGEQAEKEIDAKGRVLVPGFVESHVHLDKALISDRRPNKSGTLQEAITVTAELKPTFTKEDVYDRARRVLDMIVAHGVTAIRSHAEFDPAQGFTGFDTILDLKEEYKNLVDIQVVAFPQEGIFKAPGTEKMMHEAMEKGADVVGGIPYNDAPANEHIDLIFEIAKKYDKDIDLHQDFSDEADNISIEHLCKKTIEEGYQGRVTVGHFTAMHALPDEKFYPIIELMKEANIHVISYVSSLLRLNKKPSFGQTQSYFSTSLSFGLPSSSLTKTSFY